MPEGLPPAPSHPIPPFHLKNLTSKQLNDNGGDPRSIKFFHRIGIDYVSCSPHLVPVARLAAAKASI
ncbi:MAG: hypothetical protein MK488_02120 [SAR324 cluster bacterium]|nr:hypothetical protein [SAR324 cluster bacterium]